MARRKAAAPPADETTTPPAHDDAAEGTGDAPVRRRRRRKTIAAPDYANETVALVEAVLRGRASKGATAETLQAVVNWARGVRGEGEVLRELASRPRRPKTQAAGDRVVRYEMNHALLDGVLAGTIALEIANDGDLTFLHSAYVGAGNLEPAPEMPPDEE